MYLLPKRERFIIRSFKATKLNYFFNMQSIVEIYFIIFTNRYEPKKEDDYL